MTKFSPNMDGNITTKPYKINSNLVKNMDMLTMVSILILFDHKEFLIKLFNGIMTELMLKEKFKSILWLWKNWISYKSLTVIKNSKSEHMANKIKCTYSKNGLFSEVKEVINVIFKIILSKNLQRHIKKWSKNITDLLVIKYFIFLY